MDSDTLLPGSDSDNEIVEVTAATPLPAAASGRKTDRAEDLQVLPRR